MNGMNGMSGQRPTVVPYILFDLDGTLVDTWALYLEAFLRTLEPYLGRRLSVDEMRTLHPTSEVRALGHVVPADLVGDAHAALLGHYEALHATHFAGPYPGVPEMLDALRALGCTLGIVTGKSSGAWAITHRAAGLGEFAVFVGDDHVREAKPSPDGLHLALERLEAAPGQVLYVGDSVSDAQAARDAGIRFAAALWAKRSGDVPAFLGRVREVGCWAELPDPRRLVGLVAGGMGRDEPPSAVG
jgi:HAD superfamily hydrolase (TIGR01509 family)